MSGAGWLAWLVFAAVSLASLLASTRHAGKPFLASPALYAELGGAPRIETPPDCLAAPPRRITSAALVSDEILLELVEPARLAGVSYVVDWPGSTPVAGFFSKTLPRVTNSTEHILSTRPDLVVVSDYIGVATPALLTEAGVCVLDVPAPRSFADVKSAFRLLATATGTSAQAETALASLQGELERLAGLPVLAPPPRALVVHGGHSYAEGTIQDECLERAGLVNVLAEAGLRGTPALRTEQILALDPDLIFVAARLEKPLARRPDLLPADGPWRLLGAVRAGAVHAVPDSWVASITHHALRACAAYAELARENA